jgi:hypothetical protein
VTLGHDPLTLKLGEANYFRKIDVAIIGSIVAAV